MASKATEAVKEETSENLWSKILNETSRSVSGNKAPPNVLLIGDRNCGKSSLLTRLQGLELNENPLGMALDYGVIEIKGDDDETMERINIWQLEGNKGLKDLLQFSLNEENIMNSLILLVVDLSQPWNLVESLTSWLQLIERHVMKVMEKLPPGLVDELKNNLISDFQTYTEPIPGQPAKIHRKKQTEDSTVVPLDDPLVLTKNIGVPILVVGCKADQIEFLEKEYGFKDPHFDFIQQYLRRICLSYGAGLIYTSAKRSINIDILLDYIRYRLTNYGLVHKLQISEKETIFVPAGADSVLKVKTTFESQNLTTDESDPYEEIIKVPKLLQAQIKDAATEIAIHAEDDQEFLAKHKEEIDADKEKERQLKLQNPESGVTPLQRHTGTGGVPPPAQVPNITMGTGTGPTAVAPVEKPVVPAINPIAATGGPGQTTEHEMLAKFFDRLINRTPPTGGAPLPSGPGTNSPSNRSKDEMTKQLDRLRSKMGQN